MGKKNHIYSHILRLDVTIYKTRLSVCQTELKL